MDYDPMKAARDIVAKQNESMEIREIADDFHSYLNKAVSEGKLKGFFFGTVWERENQENFGSIYSFQTNLDLSEFLALTKMGEIHLTKGYRG